MQRRPSASALRRPSSRQLPPHAQALANRPRPPQPPPSSETQQEEQEEAKEAKEDEIPPLTSVAPAIFVPIPENFFSDFTVPTTKIGQLEATLATIDAHAAQVRSNIIALADRECTRLVRQAEVEEAQYRASLASDKTPDSSCEKHPLAFPPADRAVMIANMSAPAPRDDQNPHGVRGQADQIPLPNFSEMKASNPREWLDRELMATVSQTLTEVKGFDAHVKRTKLAYEQALEREKLNGPV